MRTENTLALFPDQSGTGPAEGSKRSHAPSVAQQTAAQRNTIQSCRTANLPVHSIQPSHPDHRSRNLEDEQLLTVNEFADLLRVTRACVRKWILLRKIGVVKVGRLVRLRSSELRRIVEDGFRPPIERR
jgi:excisionase family DNA binding protein